MDYNLKALDDRIKKLVEAGAGIGGSLLGSEMVLARAILRNDSHGRPCVKWAGAFPVDQQHFHMTPYDTVEVYYDRDVGFLKNGELILYIAPLEEWFVPDEYYETHKKWMAFMKKEGAEFCQHFDTDLL